MDLARSSALVTGASSGIGEALARSLADRGAHLVLVARRAERLERLRAEVLAAHPDRRVEVVVADLSQPGAGTAMLDEVAARGVGVDVLVNNAGFGAHGPVARQDPDEAAAMVAVNVATLVETTTRALPAMVAARRGAVLNVASIAAFVPVPDMALYAATKAFSLSYTEALWHELRGSGVQALALCPGPTETEFFARTGKRFLTRGRQSSRQVADAALDALDGRQRTVVPGLGNTVTVALSSRAPRGAALALTAQVARER